MASSVPECSDRVKSDAAKRGSALPRQEGLSGTGLVSRVGGCQKIRSSCIYWIAG